MDNSSLSVREIQEADIPLLTAYWTGLHADQLLAMGVSIEKLPPPEQLSANLAAQIALPYEEKIAYCLIWELNGIPAGHCNTNPTVYGEEAFIHLHMWDAGRRKKGIGTELVRLSLPYFFNRLQLKKLYSQPYILNPAPAAVLEKAGFEFVKEYITVPGSLNFEQPVKLFVCSKEKFETHEMSHNGISIK